MMISATVDRGPLGAKQIAFVSHEWVVLLMCYFYKI